MSELFSNSKGMLIRSNLRESPIISYPNVEEVLTLYLIRSIRKCPYDIVFYRKDNDISIFKLVKKGSPIILIPPITISKYQPTRNMHISMIDTLYGLVSSPRFSHICAIIVQDEISKYIEEGCSFCIKSTRGYMSLFMDNMINDHGTVIYPISICPSNGKPVRLYGLDISLENHAISSIQELDKYSCTLFPSVPELRSIPVYSLSDTIIYTYNRENESIV